MAAGINKIDDGWLREQREISERMNKEHIAKHDRSFYGHLAKLADERNPVTEETRSAIAPPSHRASQIADLLVESGSHPDRSAALDYLMHSSRGAALLHRMSKAEAHTGKESSMDKTETLRDIAKAGGIIAVAKAIIDENRSYGITEHEFVALATEHAKAAHPDLTEAAAFAKLYQIPEVWRACELLKSMPFVAEVVPVMVGGESAQAVNDPSEAIAQLKQLGARKWPTATEADQFERALTAPENHVLARRAVPVPRATTSFPFPR
jgi:hypothetical protein